MERLSVFGLLLAILCAITSKYASYGDTKFSNCSKRIDCDNSTGAVVSIDLRNPFPVDSDSSSRYGFWNLSGEIRPSLLKLKSLEYLDLSLNTFNAIPIPEFLGSLENLHYLNLSTSGFSGAVPSNLGNLSRLQYLDLSTEFSSLSCDSLEWVTGLVSLKHLAMNNVDLSLVGSDWISVLNMNLTELHLSSCLLTGSIPSTKPVNSTSFAVLDLSSNPLNSELPDWLVNVSTLVHVDLSNCNLYERIPLGFGELPNLQYFNLAGNNNLSASCSQLFRGSWKMIRYINLASNKLHGKLPSSIGNMTFLTNFDLSMNNVGGGIPSSIGKLCNLKEFDFFGNNLTGPIPASLGDLQNLTKLSLEGNELNGTLPESFGNLSELSMLDVSVNHLTGFISEVHFSRVRVPNPLNVAPYADVDLSSNLLEGPIPVPNVEIELLDLSHNRFSGSIPQNISESMPNLIFLSLSGNQLTGEIPASIGEMLLLLQVIDLSRNNISGTIPSSIGNCSLLKVLDLADNNLSGEIPASLGQLRQLQSLHLNDNKLTGNIPLSFQTLSTLATLDLGNNRFSGDIPLWIGDGFADLRILKLRSNGFSGEIPPNLSDLSSLQVLDLAENNLKGRIPGSLGDLQAMAREQIVIQYLLYGKYRGLYYEENLIITTKNQLQTFTKTLSLVTSLDLSGNNFSGDFPEELKKLSGLVVLNLSRNHISGKIPENISSLHQLSSLDLSSNNLSGSIPPTLSSLSFLGYLNLSNNFFSGTIPYAEHLTTFDASSFTGNPDLCGPPLPVKCRDAESDGGGSVIEEDNDGNEQEVIDKWFYMSIGLGFAAGILFPILVLAIRKPWSDDYFNFLDRIVDKWLWVEKKRSLNQRR
ncbi:hypothetical protein Dsin_010925 [Dipteronia sinensis]|uniref:Disease resistance R13L4/SHOC-2-like LRR domain-containing protein n=1 Tax=Dipteronia sinensis TaxID=43782 RepID=A0AAE0EEV3_9ROSI|nr:hypothetical protein Dsin_010925 [Dipteronia sinensis]